MHCTQQKLAPIFPLWCYSSFFLLVKNFTEATFFLKYKKKFCSGKFKKITQHRFTPRHMCISFRLLFLLLRLLHLHFPTDVDECQRHPCHPNAICVNTIGAYTCTCREPYVGDGHTCKRMPPTITCLLSHGNAFEVLGIKYESWSVLIVQFVHRRCTCFVSLNHFTPLWMHRKTYVVMCCLK